LAHDAERVLREPTLRRDEMEVAMKRAVEERLGQWQLRLADRKAGWKAHHPRLVVEQRREGLRQFRLRYVQQARHSLQGMGQRLERARRLLKTLGPESAFERGFSITLTASGDLVTDPAQVGVGDRIATRVAGGTIESEVVE
jgi:exodeoxyribonuclease VII large subunit